METINVRTMEDSRGTRLSGLWGLTSDLFSGGVISSFAEDVGVDSGGTWTASALVIARLRQGRVQGRAIPSLPKTVSYSLLSQSAKSSRVSKDYPLGATASQSAPI